MKINANPVIAATKQRVSTAFYVQNFTTYQIQPGLTRTGLSGLTWVLHALLNQRNRKMAEGITHLQVHNKTPDLIFKNQC